MRMLAAVPVMAAIAIAGCGGTSQPPRAPSLALATLVTSICTAPSGPSPATSFAFPNGGPGCSPVAIYVTAGREPYTAQIGTTCGGANTSAVLTQTSPSTFLLSTRGPGSTGGPCPIIFSDASVPPVTTTFIVTQAVVNLAPPTQTPAPASAARS